MKKNGLILCTILIIASSFAFLETKAFHNFIEETENSVDVYAVLFDQFPEEVNGTIMCSALDFKDTLLNLGWSPDNIATFIGEENMTKSIFLEQLNYLEEVVDENDLVFIYLSAHGHDYCRDVLDMNSWFQEEFYQINTNNKIFLMDACYGGEFVSLFSSKCYAMSSVAEDEIAILYFYDSDDPWLLSEPQFGGGISTHFWTKALTDLEADTSQDGVVGLNEMYDFSLEKIRNCYNETFEIYPAYADYAVSVAGSTINYPHPVVAKNLPYDLTLNATDFILNNEKYVGTEDLEDPIINCKDILYFDEADKELELIFEISDNSDFSYYCYVNEVLETWGEHKATGIEKWEMKYTLTLNQRINYTIKISATDEWGNNNCNSTLVIYVGETDTANYNYVISILAVLFSTFLIHTIRAKKRKD